MFATLKFPSVDSLQYCIPILPLDSEWQFRIALPSLLIHPACLRNASFFEDAALQNGVLYAPPRQPAIHVATCVQTQRLVDVLHDLVIRKAPVIRHHRTLPCHG